MNLSNPVVQRRMMAILVAALLGYLYFGTTFLPICYRVQRAEIARVAIEVAEKEWKVSLAMSKAGQIEVLQQRLREMEADWREVEKLLPREEDMPAVIKDMARLAGSAGVKIDLLQPGAPVSEEAFTSRSVEMRVHGNYHQVGEFLSHIANAPRVIRTESLTLMGMSDMSPRKGPKVLGDDGTVEATFKATLYMTQGSAMTQSNTEEDHASG